MRNPAHTALSGKQLAGVAPGSSGRGTHPVSLTRVRGSDSGPSTSQRNQSPYILTELGAILQTEVDTGLQTES